MRDAGGYILVTVLGTMLVLSGLVASATFVGQSALRSVRAADGAAQLDALARGGLELAAYQLFVLHAPFAEVNGRPLRFAGGGATAHFSDEAGRIDVNAAAPAVLLAAFRAAGLDESEASTLVTRTMIMREGGSDAPMLPPDAVVTPPKAGGAPHPSTSAVAASHGTFRAVADFITFAGADREVARRLGDLLTTSNPDGKVDVLTADRRVLLALPGMSEALADSVLAERKGAMPVVERLKAELGNQASFIKFEPGPCYGVTIAVRDARGHRAQREGIVAAAQSPQRPFHILAWE